MSSNSSDDEMPELEEVSSTKTTDYSKTVDEIKAEENKKNKEFEKGINKNNIKNNSKIDSIPKEDNSNLGKINDEIKKNFVSNSKEMFKSEEFMQKVRNNPDILKGFNDPEIMDGINIMTTDPKKAMEKYGNNKKFMEFMKNFGGLMGDYYDKNIPKFDNNIKEISSKPSNDNDKLSKLIASNPQLKTLLEDPEVKSFLKYLSKGNYFDFNMLRVKNPQLANKIFYLIQSGFLNIQTHT